MAGSRFIAIFSSDVPAIVKLAKSLSPRVALHSSGAVLCTVPASYERQTFDRLLEMNAASGTIHFAAASNPTTALLAARVRSGTSIPRGKERETLSKFPIHALILEEDEELPPIIETLDRWGIRTLGELGRLPAAELASRLGEKALRLQELARGEEGGLLETYRDKPRFQGSRELEWELDGLEPLAFALRSILDHICSQLFERGLATDSLLAVFRLTDGSTYRREVPLASPMYNSKTLLSLLLLKLQADSPRAPIKRIFLEARPARPQVIQHSLLESKAPPVEELSRTVARLSALTGRQGLGTASIDNTHRPDAFSLRPFPGWSRRPAQEAQPAFRGCNTVLVLKRLRPPRPARIQTEQIAACSGPWRTSGEWWQPAGNPSDPQPQNWEREEWDVEMVDGNICRIFWDGLKKEWFLDGVYD